MHALQNHVAFAGESAGRRPFSVSARKVQVCELFGQRRGPCQAERAERGPAEQSAAAGFAGKSGIEHVHYRSPIASRQADRGAVAQAIRRCVSIDSADELQISSGFVASWTRTDKSASQDKSASICFGTRAVAERSVVDRRRLRWIVPGEDILADLQTSRVNVVIAEDGTIKAAACY
jgi:hypothetical protein